MKNLFILLSACVFLLGSCTETIVEIDEENFANNSYNIVSCHNEQDWTKEDLESAVIGKWEYVIGWCGWTGLIEPDFDKQTIKFEEDGTATIKTDKEEETTTWEVFESNGNRKIMVEDFGAFYVCGDKITTYSSPRDGCDRTFSK